jgi:hypothetical protein
MTERPHVRRLVDRICETIGPRPAGSLAEENAARLLEQELAGWGVPAAIERFRVAPAELHALMLLGVSAYVTATLVYFVAPVATLVLLSSIGVVLLANRVLGLDLVEAVLPHRQSTNVVGRIAPSGERREIVVFSGHHDSAHRMPLLAYRRLIPVLIGALLFLFASAAALWAVSLWRVVAGPGIVLAIVELVVVAGCLGGSALALGVVAGMLRTDSVPGANDNLTAVAVAWELARELAADPPRHTEVWVAAFGSEEVGLKGSAAFARAHRADLQAVRATIVNLECLGQTGKLRVLTGERVSLTRHSERAVSLVEEAAVEAGVSIHRQLLGPGLTDATSFSRGGLEATTLIRLADDGFLDHYHTTADRPESVAEGNLVEALAVCREVVRALDGPVELDEVDDPSSEVPPDQVN